MKDRLPHFHKKPLKIPHFLKHSKLDEKHGLQTNCFINQDITCEEFYLQFEKAPIKSFFTKTIQLIKTYATSKRH